MLSRPQLVWIFVVALLVRLSYAWLALLPIGWDQPGIDYGSELGSIARNIVEGRGFASPFGPGDAPTAWLAPLVPYLWAGVFQVLGLFSTSSLYCLLGLQVLASALSCVVLVRIAAWCMERMPSIPRHRLWWIATLFVLWPEALERLEHLWYFAFQELALAWMFLEGLRWLDQPDTKRALRLGLGAGLLALIHPGALLLFAFLLVLPMERGKTHSRARFSSVAIGGLACCLLLTPWTWRNAVVFEKLIPLRSNFGVELLQGNGPRATPVQQSHSQHPAVDPIERERYEGLGEIEYMSAAKREAVEYIQADWGAFTWRTAQRMVLFWTSDIFDRWTWTPRAPWWSQGVAAILRRCIKLGCFLAPLALLFVGLWRRGWPRVPGSAALVGLLVVMPLPYYVTHLQPAYSYTVRPYLLLLGCLLWFGQQPSKALSSASGTTRSSRPQDP